MTDDLTALDRAHLAAEAAPEDEARRWRVYEALAGSELFVLLAAEAVDGPPVPQVFDLDEGRFVLAFDREDRLTAFTGGPAAYAGLPGRALAAMLAREGLGLGLNLGEMSSRLLPPDALAWLVEALAEEPAAHGQTPVGHLPFPGAAALAAALRPRLAGLTGLARALYLTEAQYADGHRAPLLSVETTTPEAPPTELRTALARMLSEALRFAAAGPDQVDIAVLPLDAPELAALRDVAQVLTPPAPVVEASEAPKGPGLDPAKPPILKF